MYQVTKINANLKDPYLLRVHEKQYDCGRWIYAKMMDGDVEYVITEGTVGIMAIRKPDGTACVYDTESLRVTDYSTTAEAVEVDSDVYCEHVDGAGEREFDYDGTDWFYNGDTVSLADFGITVAGAESGDTITVVCVAVNAVIIDGNTVKVLLVDQALTAYGEAICDISLVDTEGRITSYNFLMEIEAAAVQDEEIVSTGYINILTEKMRQVIELLNNLPVSGNEHEVLTKTANGYAWKKVATELTGQLVHTNWVGSTPPYTQEKPFSDVLATDAPLVDVNCTGTYATDANMCESWARVYRVVATEGKITFYASEVPEYDIDFRARIVR